MPPAKIMGLSAQAKKSWKKLPTIAGIISGPVGGKISFSADGNTIAVGDDWGTDGVLVADFNGTEWIKRPKFPTTPAYEANYGVALSADGKTILSATSYYTTTRYTTLYLYDWNGSAWVYRGTVGSPISTGSREIRDATMSSAGNSIAASYSSSNYVNLYWYQLVNTNWTSMAMGTLQNEYRTVSISDNGTRLMVISPIDSTFYGYSYTTSVTKNTTKLSTATTYQPSNLQVNGAGTTTIVSRGWGGVELYDVTGTTWNVRSSPLSGFSGNINGVSLSDAVDTIAASSTANTKFVQKLVDGVWTPQTLPAHSLSSISNIKLSKDGETLAISGSGTPFVETYKWM